ncbi:UvrD-helicase domain-containing protein [Crocosphaera sp.]|uniref:UvrD-helicase domain-containing protein n=1 Tax=Crocosphaera sp. TaxID=2729996 RepID=UPI003F1E9A38|nr:UvrD-helicase domain-containing protein [Crocosphaera sp.]
MKQKKKLTMKQLFTCNKFKKKHENDDFQYDLIFVDEVQDLKTDTIEILKRKAKRLIVAGDEEQSIYPDTVKPEKITEITKSSPYSLTFLYRLTPRIIKIAQIICPEKRLNEAKQTRMPNVQVILGKARTKEEEVRYVWEQAYEFARPGRPVGILFPEHKMIVEFAKTILRVNNCKVWQEKTNKWGNPDYGSLNRHIYLKISYVYGI